MTNKWKNTDKIYQENKGKFTNIGNQKRGIMTEIKRFKRISSTTLYHKISKFS